MGVTSTDARLSILVLSVASLDDFAQGTANLLNVVVAMMLSDLLGTFTHP